jgi:nucleoside-diphosphate-sugar epimerase
MKILVTGNLGYVGGVVVKHLKSTINKCYIAGFDTGYFSHCLTTISRSPDTFCNQQYYGDIRHISSEFINQFDAIVLLSAISNDPMGAMFEKVTEEINYKSCIELIDKIKNKSLKTVVFASSCSMYGIGGSKAKIESDNLNPLTAYARSKVAVEKALEKQKDSGAKITSLRFSTACGMSDRLRLDLVLNDFVASALTTGIIEVLSDGSPWRPLINVTDMARAIEWALTRSADNTNRYLAVNVGSNKWNYQVKELALAVSKIMPDTKVNINTDAQPDKRSYKVDFSLYEALAINHQPLSTLDLTILELVSGLKKIKFNLKEFRNSEFIRLNVLNNFINNGLLDGNLYWIEN